MLSSGINPQNIHVHTDWQTVLPDVTDQLDRLDSVDSSNPKYMKYKWQVAHQNGLKLAEFLM